MKSSKVNCGTRRRRYQSYSLLLFYYPLKFPVPEMTDDTAYMFRQTPYKFRQRLLAMNQAPADLALGVGKRDCRGRSSCWGVSEYQIVGATTYLRLHRRFSSIY